ncbi:lipopolysaccharide export system permease protein [Roseibium hamelinense]|uniref:Lipopolysaccharide export system permease protein n=1 Tax=Roseibium hamelinense TaxID=150831 RepID=A0A562THW9_9HYPH|nr:LPS export ABC transporter permease LptG [Roseibium hamelinense]MTI42314.1 LPS export ABC transporter permease LptG [Roseibium hamelinense]TWI93235.1 lipopolysaccharide export system permease protein [Roseibium hamelinense]
MILGRTLAVYFSARFLKAILGLFLLATVLIFLFDVLELIRRGGDREGFSVLRVSLISALRVPLLMEQVIPFTVLFGAIAAFVSLSRALELVVTRASGISVWQFCLPALAVGVGIGILSVTAYNPAAVWLQQKSDDVATGLFGSDQSFLLQSTSDVWVRQDGLDGESVLKAQQLLDGGARLKGVTIFTFDKSGTFRERIEAKDAMLGNNVWDLYDAIVYTTERDPQIYGKYSISTFLTATEVRESIGSPESISFWKLPSFIELAQNAGLPAYRYALQYQTLLARPLLLAAMILIAAAVSLKVSRFGGLGGMILGGILAGFVLYVLSELAEDFGGAGIVPPMVAAWAPGVFGVLMGLTILLHQEDG